MEEWRWWYSCTGYGVVLLRWTVGGGVNVEGLWLCQTSADGGGVVGWQLQRHRLGRVGAIYNQLKIQSALIKNFTT